jgi:nucleotide-binding universal stress UspA family protein
MKVLVAIDFSDVSGPTLGGVKRLLASDDHKITLLHVVEQDPAFAGITIPRDQQKTKWHKELRTLRKMAAGLEKASINVTPLLLRGPFIKTILDEADQMDADLIVVGSHGHGATYDIVVGSVSAGVIRKASHPVLVFPMPDKRES